MDNKKFKVITLCGSSRFKDEFIKAAEELTLAGNIVISLGLFGHADNKYDTVITEDIKQMLDDAHKEKINMSDAIYVINPGGYIGESTRNEIDYAKKCGKEIMYLVHNYTYRGSYMSLRSLEDNEHFGVIKPSYGDIYLVKNNRGCRDVFGSVIDDMSFVTYNPSLKGWECIDIRDFKLIPQR